MRLLVRPSFSNSEGLGLLFHGIVVIVEHHMLSLLSLSRSLKLWVNSALNCTLTARAPSGT